MPVPQLLLDRFPVELIFDIFTYLTAIEIVDTFYNFSRYLRECIRSYEEYRINLKSIPKIKFDRLCNLIRPDQIMTLTISDDEETPGQMNHFFTRFPTFEKSFIRLEHLHIQNFEEFPILSAMECLHTMTVDFERWAHYSFDYNRLRQYENKLVNMFRLPTLRTLILNNESLNIDFNFNIFPINENIYKFKIHLKTIDNLSFIFKSIPNLQQLILSTDTISIDNNFPPDCNVPLSLTHLTIMINYGVRDGIQQIIQSCSTLIYLKIHIKRNHSDLYQWLDGNWWQLLIETFLPQLKIFRLRIDLNPALDLTITKDLLESFETAFWTNNEGKHRSLTIGVTPFHKLPVDCKQKLVINKTLYINMRHKESSMLPSNDVSNIEILRLEHGTLNNECYIVSDLSELERYMNNLSKLVHLKLQNTCSITSSVFSQLLLIAPRLTRLTISSSQNHLHGMLDLKYPQIRWLDMRREYLSSKIVTKFCSSFPCLEHLINCHVYIEDDLEILIENLNYLQNITIHIQSYYFDDNEEFDQWLRKHTHLKNFTFKLINERQIQLWIGK